MERASDGALKILLVEDNPGDARLVMELFREQPTEAVDLRHVTRVSEALKTLEEEDYDVVLLDLSLPDGSGVVTVQRIRASAAHVPVVVLSGLGDERTAMAAVQEGADDFLIKSETHHAGLLRAVRYAMERHRRMHRIAYYDGLTGLPNRALFRDRLTQALVRGRRHGDTSALLFIDLDGFKRINDGLGHECGDAVLRIAASRMCQSLRASDVLARYGGDEFTALLPGLARYEDAVLVAEKVRRAVATPQVIGGNDASLTASIGVALIPLDGTEVDALLQAADSAMYRGKEQGKNQIVFASPTGGQRQSRALDATKLA